MVEPQTIQEICEKHEDGQDTDKTDLHQIAAFVLAIQQEVTQLHQKAL
jgi:hypothetical protein